MQSISIQAYRERLIVVSLPSGIFRLAIRSTRCPSTCTTTKEIYLHLYIQLI